MLFHTSSHSFFAMSEYIIFHPLSTSIFKIEVSFNEKDSSVRSSEKAFKSLNNFIVRKCGIF